MSLLEIQSSLKKMLLCHLNIYKFGLTTFLPSMRLYQLSHFKKGTTKVMKIESIGKLLT